MDIQQANMIKLLGIESLPDEEKARIVEQTGELVQKRVLIRVMDSLSEEKREGFVAILDSADEVALNNFLQQNCPQFAEWLAEELAKIKAEMAGLAKSA